MSKPIVEQHEGIFVVRDDLYSGGTKARFLRTFMEPGKEYIYASPVEGGAQTSLCTVAREIGAKATIFVAKRNEQHPRIKLDKKLGGKVVQVEHGYLNVVQAAARVYSEKGKNRVLMPFGFDSPEAVETIAKAAASMNVAPRTIWCASGSGTLARALGKAFPDAKLNVVQIGRTLTKKDVGKAKIHIYPRPFGWALPKQPPFPSDPHYDAKAWDMLMQQKKRNGPVLFYNVMGPAI